MFFLQIATKRRADERTRTADLTSLRVIGHPLQTFALVCKSRIDKGCIVSGLLRVGPYCIPGGIRVVSGGDGLSLFQRT